MEKETEKTKQKQEQFSLSDTSQKQQHLVPNLAEHTFESLDAEPQTKRPRISSGRFFLNPEEQMILNEYSAQHSSGATLEHQQGFGFHDYSEATSSRQLGLISEHSTKTTSKKGSVISPDDRRPPDSNEINFYQQQVVILHNLIAYNMQYLAFFPQATWLEPFTAAVQSSILPSPETAVKQEPSDSHFHDDHNVFDEFLLEPENDLEPLLNLTFAPFAEDAPKALDPLRRRSSLRIVSRSKGQESSSNSGVVSSPVVTVEELVVPRLPKSLAIEISSLTTFQKNLARYKCREVSGFFRLLLKNRSLSKLSCAQLLENSSRFVVRTILNWAREYFQNNGRFNRSKIGKHKRVTLFTNQDFRAALLEYAAEKGDSISVDSASQFIKDYHARIVATDPMMRDLPAPPSSRATVHRWLKLLNIKLGPRGKKKSSHR